MASEHGPFRDEREVLATRAAAALRAACDANPRGWEAEHLKVMTEACEAAGVPLGAFDLAPFRQLAMYEAFHAVVIAAIIHRAFEAGKAAGPDGAAVKLLEEALFLRQNGEYAPGGRENWHDWDRNAETFLRGLLPPEREDGEHA